MKIKLVSIIRKKGGFTFFKIKRKTLAFPIESGLLVWPSKQQVKK